MALNTLRYNRQPLTDEELRRHAPSIFAQHASSLASEKYVFIPTVDIVNAMREQGFYPIAAFESASRKEATRGFTKHMIKFRQFGANPLKAVGDLLHEVTLFNAHTPGTSYQLDDSVFRLACLNGMIAKLGTIDAIKIPHKGNIVNDVIEGTFKIIERAPTLVEHISAMQDTIVPEPVKNSFAKAVMSLRWDEGKAPVTAEQILMPRRGQDRSNDLFTTMNVIQENMIQGGLRGRNASNHVTITKPVGAVGENLKLNRAIWQMAEQVRELLGEAKVTA